jgi:hypothetical protein
MKTNKLACVIAVAGLASVAGSAWAQSAKFTAAWETDKVTLDEFNINYTPTGDSVVTATEVMSTIHVPNQKELLIGVSGVANLVTITEAKGRNGGFESVAVAETALDLEVRVVPEGVDPNCGGVEPQGGMIAAPGPLTFASRRQELKVTVDLDVVDVAGTCGGDGQPACIAYTLDIEGDVTVALGLDTTAAHHFNFVAPDLDQGTYDVVACFSGNAAGMVTEEEVGDNSVRAYVAVMQRMLTVQEVRAVQGDFIEMD